MVNTSYRSGAGSSTLHRNTHDFYDLEQIDEFYQKNGISINDGIFNHMFETEMIDILSGKYTHPVFGVPYNIVIKFEGDDVLNHYGLEGIIIAGLLLGYPLEATANLIRGKLEYFISHPRFENTISVTD